MANTPVIVKDLGLVTAYGYALAGGYQGTEAQFIQDFAALMSGQYTALANKPSINGVTLTGNKTSADLGLSTITDYGDLSGKPSINSVPLSDNKTAADLGLQEQLTAGQNISIQNGVISAASTGTTNYNNLSNKPSINSVSLEGNKTIAQLGLQAALTAGTNISIENNVISATGGGSTSLSVERVTNSTSDFDTGTLGDRTVRVNAAVAYRWGRITIIYVECGSFANPATITQAYAGTIGRITNIYNGKLQPYNDKACLGIAQCVDDDTAKPLNLATYVSVLNSVELRILPTYGTGSTELHIRGDLTNSIFAYYAFINNYLGGD